MAGSLPPGWPGPGQGPPGPPGAANPAMGAVNPAGMAPGMPMQVLMPGAPPGFPPMGGYPPQPGYPQQGQYGAVPGGMRMMGPPGVAPQFPGAPPQYPPQPPGFYPPMGMAGVAPLMQPPVQPQPPKAATDWAQHKAADGRTYYHNKTTGQSSWEKPKELMTAIERADASTPWREHSAPDGRKYFYNKESKESKWSIPPDLQAARDAALRAEAALTGGAMPPAHVSSVATSDAPSASDAAARSRAAAPSAPAIAMPTVNVRAADEVPKAAPGGAPPMSQIADNLSKDEAKQVFKDLLTAHNITSNMNWEKTMKVIVLDPRYGVLKTIGEKKTAFNEYITQKAKLEKEEKTKRERGAREDFRRMLEGHPGVTPDTRLSEAETLFKDDSRWSALDSAKRERDEIYRDFVQELRKRADEERRAAKQAARDAYRKALEKMEGIKVSSRWAKVHDNVEEPPEAFSLPEQDKLEVFQEYIRDLEKADELRKAEEKARQKRQERRNREAFLALLEQRRAEGKLTARSVWKAFEKEIEGEEAYLLMKTNVVGSRPKARPKELFQDVIDELEDAFEAEKGAVVDALKGLEFTVREETTVEELRSKAQEAGGKAAEVSEGSLQIILGDLKSGERRERRKAAEDFQSLLKKKVGKAVEWDEARPTLEEDKRFAALASEEERKRIFGEFVEELKQREVRGDKEEKKDKKGKKDKKSKKHRKRSRSRSDDSDSGAGGKGKKSKRSRSRSASAGSRSAGKKKRRDDKEKGEKSD